MKKRPSCRPLATALKHLAVSVTSGARSHAQILEGSSQLPSFVLLGERHCLWQITQGELECLKQEPVSSTECSTRQELVHIVRLHDPLYHYTILSSSTGFVVSPKLYSGLLREVGIWSAKKYVPSFPSSTMMQYPTSMGKQGRFTCNMRQSLIHRSIAQNNFTVMSAQDKAVSSSDKASFK